MKLTLTKNAQLSWFFLAAVAAVGECLFVVNVSEPQSEFPLPTIFLYIGFFWLLWAYARIEKPIQAVVKLPKVAVWIIFASIISMIAYAYDHQSEVMENAQWFGKFVSLHAILVGAYSFACVALFFGDDFFWPASKLLKFGREFDRS